MPPIYEFECLSPKCGAIFEEYQSLGDPPLKKCKVCKRGKVIKIMSVPGRPVIMGNSKDDYIKVKEEARQTAQKIMKGDQEAIADVYGDDAASGKPITRTSKVKTLDNVKGGVIKRK